MWVTWPRESLGTLVANKLLSCVGDLVSLHTTWIRESLVALGAGKLFISCVGHPVNLQVFCPRENLGRLVADKMAFSSSGNLSDGKACHTGCRHTASLLCGRDCVTSIHLTWSTNYFYLVWTSMCSLSLSNLWKPFSHLLQENVYSSVWEHVCLFRLPDSEKESCRNCLWNCVMPLFTPLEVQFSKIFVLKIYSSLIWNAKLVLKVTFERYRGEESRIWKIRGLANHKGLGI